MLSEAPSNLSQTPSAPGATSWASVWAGAVIALGVVALFLAAGLGSSAAAIDVHADGWWRAPLGIAGGSGAAALLAALFVGGAVAAWGSGARLRLDGVVHGAAVWGVVAIALTWLVGSSASYAIGGVAKVVQGGAQIAGKAVGEGASALGSLGGAAADVSRQAAGKIDMNFDAMLQPVNAKLRLSGRKPVSSGQIKNIGRNLMDRGLREGVPDRAAVIDAVAQQSDIAQSDAEAVAEAIQTQLDEAKRKAAQVANRLRDESQHIAGTAKAQAVGHADEVASTLSKAFWGLFVALSVSLLTALGGGVAGVGLRRRVVEV